MNAHPPPIPTAPFPPANCSTGSRIRQLNFNDMGQFDGFLIDNGDRFIFRRASLELFRR
jgi:hypothetical protein